VPGLVGVVARAAGAPASACGQLRGEGVRRGDGGGADTGAEVTALLMLLLLLLSAEEAGARGLAGLGPVKLPAPVAAPAPAAEVVEAMLTRGTAWG
jgi:hypothetical protein